MSDDYGAWATPVQQPPQQPPAQQPYQQPPQQQPPQAPAQQPYQPPMEQQPYQQPQQHSEFGTPPNPPQQPTYQNQQQNQYGSSNSGGFNPNDVVVPGLFVPIALNLGKGIPADKRAILEMMLRTCIQHGFTLRCSTDNEGTGILREMAHADPSLGANLKVEYVRPWKKFDAPDWAMRDEDWYPSLPVTKSCELLVPKLADRNNKGRAYKVLEGALIMGRAAKQTARVLITYSPDGLTQHTKGGKESAYMQNIVHFAQLFGVRVVNLGALDAREQFGSFINQFSK